MWLLEDGGSTGSIQFDIRPRTTCIAAVMAAAIYILSSISYTQLNTPFSARGTMEIYTMRTVVYFGGVALLFAYQSQLRDLLTQREADALRNMLHIQYENYKIRQESIDLINQKYHDLKHQIAVLRAESGEKRNAVLDNMEQEIKAYEAQNDTGNKVLDTVLTGKSLTCRTKNIQLTCVADGTALDFMDVMDISNLFGNALDNAIESTDKITDPERRLIHLSVARQKGFAAIRIENCFDGELKFEKGLPVTTKKDVLYHGFGVKSIQNAAAKYGGTATITTREGWFELRVLIPLGQPQQDKNEVLRPCIGKRRAGGVVCAEKVYVRMPCLAMCTKSRLKNLVKPDETKNRLCEKERISCKSCAAARFLWYGRLTEKRRISGRAARPTKEENTCLKSHA